MNYLPEIYKKTNLIHFLAFNNLSQKHFVFAEVKETMKVFNFNETMKHYIINRIFLDPLPEMVLPIFPVLWKDIVF